jgi:hypothetical protein
MTAGGPSHDVEKLAAWHANWQAMPLLLAQYSLPRPRTGVVETHHMTMALLWLQDHPA